MATEISMITIIIPVHNRQENIKNTLTALAAQKSVSFEDFEIIVVDDQSTDSTHEKVLEFMYRHPTLRMKFVRINKKEAWNASRPRNYGAKMAERESTHYLFVDSDVILNPDALRFYFEDIQMNPKSVFIGPYNWFPHMRIMEDDVVNRYGDIAGLLMPRLPMTGRIGIIGNDPRHNKFAEVGVTEKFNTAHDGLACFGGNLLVPRSLFWKIGGYDEGTLCGIEDGDMGLSLWEAGATFNYDARCIGYHQWHPISDDRHPPGLKAQIDRLNRKHFGTSEQDLIDYTKATMKNWGIDSWSPPPEWEQ